MYKGNTDFSDIPPYLRLCIEKWDVKQVLQEKKLISRIIEDIRLRYEWNIWSPQYKNEIKVELDKLPVIERVLDTMVNNS